MKYLLIVALIGLVFLLWRHGRNAENGAAQDAQGKRPRRAAKGTRAMEMVACDVCHVHLPRSEALIGRNGIYCSDAHRRQGGE